jgi:4-hydroxyphenylpyruvate dioxygenase
MPNVGNPLKLRGIGFIEFCGPKTSHLDKLFWDLGFSKLKRHSLKEITYHRQNDIVLLYNTEQNGFSGHFAKTHGPSISSIGLRVEDAEHAMAEAVRHGARALGDAAQDLPYPAIYGVGDTLVYFVQGGSWQDDTFVCLNYPEVQPGRGLRAVDHLTNNVALGATDQWVDFYKDVFGFRAVDQFDIEGVRTGLKSCVLRAPDGSFSIPINEPKSENDQIAEYLRRFNGPGVQHLAFLTDDILATLDAMKDSSIQMREIEAGYYVGAFDRVPQVKESRNRIQSHHVLLDGDDRGYLLQIFTKDLVGPMFFEIIQRVEYRGFGRANFDALFRLIERDQEWRGMTEA